MTHHSMDIKASLFFVSWAIISLTFLKLGFNALDRTDLSDSVSPVILFIFKHAFAIAFIHSSDHTFIHCKQVKIQDDRYYAWILFLLVMKSAVSGPIVLYQYIYYFGYAIEVAHRPFLVKTMGAVFVLGVDCVLKLTMLGSGDGTKFIPLLAMLIGAYTSSVSAATLGEESLYDEMLDGQNEHTRMTLRKKRRKLVRFGVVVLGPFLPQREDESLSYWRRILNERRKLIEFGIGMVGTIFFQNFFRLTSFDHVLAFLYLAVSWLANLALIRARGDFGVFNFLIGNVIVGCTVSRFGLHGTTWIALGASVLLYGLRLEIESLSLADRGERDLVIVW